MSKVTEFPIVSVCKEELEAAGFDASKVTGEQMKLLATKMQESYLSKDFYKDLRKAATELGIPKITRK